MTSLMSGPAAPGGRTTPSGLVVGLDGDSGSFGGDSSVIGRVSDWGASVRTFAELQPEGRQRRANERSEANASQCRDAANWYLPGANLTGCRILLSNREDRAHVRFRRHAEQTFVFPIKLGRALVADAKPRAPGIDPVRDHEPTRFMQP